MSVPFVIKTGTRAADTAVKCLLIVGGQRFLGRGSWLSTYARKELKTFQKAVYDWDELSVFLTAGFEVKADFVDAPVAALSCCSWLTP